MTNERAIPSWQPALESLVNCDFNKVIPEDQRDDFNQFIRSSVETNSGFLVTYDLQSPDGRLRTHAFYYSSDNKVISAREAIIDLDGSPERWGQNFTVDSHKTLEEILALPRWKIPPIE